VRCVDVVQHIGPDFADVCNEEGQTKRRENGGGVKMTNCEPRWTRVRTGRTGGLPFVDRGRRSGWLSYWFVSVYTHMPIVRSVVFPEPRPPCTSFM